MFTRMKKLADQAREILQAYVDGSHGGVKSRAAKALGIANVTLKQWLEGSRVPNLENLSPAFERLGIGFAVPQVNAGKEVCFVNARVVAAGEAGSSEPPQAEDYLAVPMVGEVGAGHGYIPQDEIKSWFLVYRNVPAIRHRSNFIAVEIGAHSDSMQPTLNPGDIVLVDRDDRNTEYPGHMMLVIAPDGGGMIKRVAVQNMPDRDCHITFYSDNTAKWPPTTYSLRYDYDGDWNRAIVGRVIWAWSDVREK